jgi:hypothetical protein
VRVVVEDRPIRGDDRCRVPGVPYRDTEDGRKVPVVLYPVVLKTDEGELTIGWSVPTGPQKIAPGPGTPCSAARRVTCAASAPPKRQSGSSSSWPAVSSAHAEERFTWVCPWRTTRPLFLEPGR